MDLAYRFGELFACVRRITGPTAPPDGALVSVSRHADRPPTPADRLQRRTFSPNQSGDAA